MPDRILIFFCFFFSTIHTHALRCRSGELELAHAFFLKHGREHHSPLQGHYQLLYRCHKVLPNLSTTQLSRIRELHHRSLGRYTPSTSMSTLPVQSHDLFQSGPVVRRSRTPTRDEQSGLVCVQDRDGPGGVLPLLEVWIVCRDTPSAHTVVNIYPSSILCLRLKNS